LISLYLYYLIIEISAIKLNDEIKRKLSPGFEMKDIGQMHYYLGIEVWMEDGYSDSDWERDPHDRKSTTGYAFNIGSRIVSWSNKKQPIIYLSSIETKYKALCSSTCEAIWLRHILEDIGERQGVSTSIKCDNQSLIKLGNNPIYHAR